MSQDSTNFLAAVDSAGTVRFVYTKPVGALTQGNFVQILLDGTTVFSNKDGKVLKVVCNSSGVYEYFYDRNSGQLNEISLPDLSIWSLGAAGNWYLINQDKVIVKRLNFKPSVDQDGTLWLRERDGSYRHYIRRSGR
ncbi:hypothetical protein BH10CYA1_BH10CYA1_17870 [soil metagenome]